MIKVLIVDNNVELCQTLSEFLGAQHDLEVVGVAYNGEEALQRLQEIEVDVVLLDITMPHLDGLAVMERMRRLSLNKIPRVIVLTALSRDDLVKRFTELGADYFIVKPFDLDILVKRIRQFGAQQSGSTEIRETGEIYKQTASSIDERRGVTRLLQEMGIPAHFKGYTYLREAVLTVLRDESMLNGSLTKNLYPHLAEKYDTTPSGVEAAIRNAVLAAWEKGNREFIESLASNGQRKGRFPTNSVVIAKLADELRYSTTLSTY